jgi:hypothetical protein
LLRPLAAFDAIVASQQDDAEVARGEPNAFQSNRGNGPRRDVCSLDEEVWPGDGAKLTELPPKPSLDERRVKVEDRLPLDDRPGPDNVVTNWQAPPDDSDPILLQPSRETRRDLADIGDHYHHMAKSRCGLTAERDDSANRAITSHFA